MEINNANEPVNPPVNPVQNTSSEHLIKNKKGSLLIILGILVLLFVVGAGAYYIGTKQNKNNAVNTPQIANNTPVSPTSTPEPTETVSTSKVSQGDWTIKYVQKTQNDFVQDVYLVNTKTNNDRVIGQTYVIAPGEHAVITKDSSTVIFLAAESEGGKLDTEGVSFYSISQNKVVKSIALRDIKAALPSLSIPRNAALNSLLLSPNGNKIAMSYGYTYELDSGSDIIIIDLTTYKMITVNAKGVLKAWKDNKTLQYQVIDSTPNSEQMNIVTKEVTIN